MQTENEKSVVVKQDNMQVILATQLSQEFDCLWEDIYILSNLPFKCPYIHSPFGLRHIGLQ